MAKIQARILLPHHQWMNAGTRRARQPSPEESSTALPRHVSSTIAFGRTKFSTGTNHAPTAHPSLKRRPRRPNGDRLRYTRLVHATSNPNAISRNTVWATLVATVQRSTAVTASGSTVAGRIGHGL